MQTIFETERLFVRAATLADIDLYLKLWTDPRVMKNVGFPNGLQITRAELEKRLASNPDRERLLAVCLKPTGESIGECAIHPPDENGIASTDVKLLPQFWGNKFGVEIKRGLLDHLFAHTDCLAVEATPNVDNMASIKMQEAVGGARVREEVFEFPDSMKAYTTPVHCYVYRVARAVWEAQNRKSLA